MFDEAIPDHVNVPNESMGMKQLCALYKKANTTLQRAFNRLGIYEAIGMRVGRDFTPEQVLIIFALYTAPPKYYLSYLWLEKNGYIESLLKKHNLLDFHNNKNKPNADTATPKKVKSKKGQKKKT